MASSTSPSPTLSKDVYNLTLTVNGFSKPYAMTGWRLGYVAAPEGVAKAIDSLQSHSTSNPTSFAQKGALCRVQGPAGLRGADGRRIRQAPRPHLRSA